MRYEIWDRRLSFSLEGTIERSTLRTSYSTGSSEIICSEFVQVLLRSIPVLRVGVTTYRNDEIVVEPPQSYPVKRKPRMILGIRDSTSSLISQSCSLQLALEQPRLPLYRQPRLIIVENQFAHTNPIGNNCIRVSSKANVRRWCRRAWLEPLHMTRLCESTGAVGLTDYDEEHNGLNSVSWGSTMCNEVFSANQCNFIKCGSGADGSGNMRTGHVIHHAIDRIDRIANRATDDFGSR